jgi:GTP-binding protein EngB required for normal cell division/gas vesicle protein
MREDNYFSWNNIGEMADINSHIHYAKTLLNKYEWASLTKRNIDKQLNAITKKQNDKQLNISVIGEFSTGKSSFINALVGFELLAVNILQGTTIAITIIEYSDEFAITLTDFDEASTKETYANIDSLRQHLHLYTTDPKYGKKINYVTVTLPSPILKRGFRIIDTPGTNSLELWHEEVTKKAIAELSDLSIILVDATKAMPETLMAFVDNTLGTAVKDCVFVANKIDLIKDRERNSIVRYVGIKAAQNFEIEEPVIFPFSSVALTNTFSRDKVKVDDDSFMLTTNSLGNLLSHTANQRVKAQARKVLQLIEDMYAILDRDIQKIAKTYNAQLKKLELSKQTDLKPFVESQIDLRQKQFLAEAQERKFDVESRGDSLIIEAINNINSKIDKFGGLDGLSSYIKSDLSSDIKEEGASISKGMEEQFSKLGKLFESEMSLFNKDFEAEFEKLKILSVKLNVKPQTISIKHSSNSANIGPVTTLITEELSKENWAFGGGAAAGAAIGTALLPGVGTIVGGIFGFVAGSFMAPGTEEVKGKVKSKLSLPINAYYRSIASDCMSNYNIYISDINQQIESEINRYYTTYKAIVQEEMARWEEQHSAVKDKIRAVTSEIKNIQSRQTSIKTIISKL